jgi:hypothetical protein
MQFFKKIVTLSLLILAGAMPAWAMQVNNLWEPSIWILFPVPIWG